MDQLFRRNAGSRARLVGRPRTSNVETIDTSDPLDAPVDRTDRTGLLGRPLRGDERSGLGDAAPGLTVADDYDRPPTERRIGEGLVADGINFQSRPSATEYPGNGDAGAGGGSGL